jgi:hypothetical protein
VLDYYYLNPIPLPPYSVPQVFINGKLADDYNFELQVGIDTAVISHEFSHTMGFPDLYHYTWDGIDPCGWWDLMDYCQGTPQHHLAYQKWRYGGWFGGIPVIPGPGNYTLNSIDSSTFDCLWMPTSNPNEYYVFEYRRQSGLYESALPGSGLIVYRVRMDLFPNGNAGGPPDEVYVYRPGGTPSSNGWIASAPYAMDLGHTILNNFTDPTPFLSSGMPGNLIMHNVGNAGGSTISFTIGANVPVVWTGAVSTAWETGGNWNTNMVPTSADYVIIPSKNLPNWPQTNIFGNQCSALRIEQNPSMSVNLGINPGSDLFVLNDLDNWGVVTLISALAVHGNLTLNNGAQLHGLAGPNTYLQMGFGDITLNTGSVFSMTAGTVEFTTTIPSNTNHIYNYTNVAYFWDLWLNNQGFVHFDSNSTHPILIQGNLTISSATTAYMEMSPHIDLMGNLTVNPGSCLNGTSGELRCVGSAPQTMDFFNTMSFLKDLRICNVVQLNSNMSVHDNLYIDVPSGHLMPMANTIHLSGDWWNYMGSPFFDPTGRVVFDGVVDQHIHTPLPSDNMAMFGILEIAKPGGALVLNTPAQMVHCDFYDHTSGTLKVMDGIFAADQLMDNAIVGNFECHAPGQIDLNNPMGTVDLEASLGIYGGTVNVFGGTTDSQWPGSSTGSGGGITMTGGMLELHQVGVVVNNPALPFVENISGGTIKVAGNFLVQRSDFNPGGGTIVCGGTGTATVSMVAGASLHNLHVNVATSVSPSPPRDAGNLPAKTAFGQNRSERYGTLNTGSDLILTGWLEIGQDSFFDIYHDVSATGNLTNHGVMMMENSVAVTVLGYANVHSGGELNIDAGASFSIGSGNTLLINNGGYLGILGTSGSPASMSSTGGGFWKLDVLGTLAAKYAEFSHLMGEGVWIQPGATVDLAADFDYCEFQGGQPGNCTFLTINNGQDLVIDGIAFPVNSGETHNIAKTVNAGSVLVNSSSGAFAGPMFEYDPNDLITWMGYDPNLIIQSFTVSDPNPYVADLVSYTAVIKNDSSFPVASGFNIHLFLNRSSPPDWDQLGDRSHACPSLSPGDTYSYTFTGIYSMTEGGWTSWLLIDPEEAIQESDEYDNRDSESLTWLALPEADDIAVTLTGTNSARISWTYPIWATRYKIYSCNDPFGTFGYLGETTDLYYDVSLSQARSFYKVTAERDDPGPN